MAAITWQNINMPAANGAIASSLMHNGAQSINTGFDNFTKILQDREKLDAANWENTKTNNTNAYMEALSSARTPEELAAKQSILAEMRQNAGAQINASAVLAATDGREAILQNRGLAGINYNNAVVDNAEAGTRDAVASLNARKEFDAAGSLAGMLTRKQGEAMQSVQNARQAEERLKEHNQMFPLDIQAKGDAHNTSVANLNRINAETAAAQGNANNSAALTNHVKDYKSAQDNYKVITASLAKAAGIPLDKAGVPVPDAAGVTPEMLNTFKASLVDVPAPPSSSVALAKFTQSLVDRGVPADKIIEMQKQHEVLVNSGDVTSAADQAVIKSNTEKLDKAKETAAKNNVFYTPKEEQLGAQTTVIKSLDSIKDGDWTKDAIKRDISSWMSGEFPLTDPNTGKVTKIAIPPKLMDLALASGKENDTRFRNMTVERVAATLNDLLTKPEYIKMQKEAADLHNGSTDVAKGNVIRGIQNQPGYSLAPNEVTKRIDAAARANPLEKKTLK